LLIYQGAKLQLFKSFVNKYLILFIVLFFMISTPAFAKWEPYKTDVTPPSPEGDLERFNIPSPIVLRLGGDVCEHCFPVFGLYMFWDETFDKS
jgi:hypothetical protein